MEVTNTMNVSDWLRKHVDEADPDLLRSMVASFAEALMSAEASALCNAMKVTVIPIHSSNTSGKANMLN